MMTGNIVGSITISDVGETGPGELQLLHYRIELSSAPGTDLFAIRTVFIHKQTIFLPFRYEVQCTRVENCWKS